MGIRKCLWSSSPPAGIIDPTGIMNGGDGGDDDCGDFMLVIMLVMITMVTSMVMVAVRLEEAEVEVSMTKLL